MDRPDEKCATCVHYRAEVLFDICAHPGSQYIVDNRPSFHTIGHMRDTKCGLEARLRNSD